MHRPFDRLTVRIYFPIIARRSDQPKAGTQQTEVREHWFLLLLWVLVLLTPLGLIPLGEVSVMVGSLEVPGALVGRSFLYAGSIAFLLLLLRLLLAGYTGYERTIGLRIIRRDRGGPRLRRWLIICWAVVVVGSALLLAHRQWGGDAVGAGGMSGARLLLVFVVAAATFFGLLLLIGRRFSVFGTTSIFGVVLGVAALLVVQSVATGFQHEFERRVLGVYAHINVTRPFGISEYRRFEKWLRTLPGVQGASPFVYYAMALAPYDPGGDREGDINLASVLVKGIEPDTAAQVIDLPEHLEVGSGERIGLEALRSDYELMPVPDGPDELLPPVIAQTQDPRGPDWYPDALEAWRQRTSPSDDLDFGGDDPFDTEDWEDPPDTEENASAAGGKLDTSTLPTMFVGKALAADLDLSAGDVVRLVDPGATFDNRSEPRFMYYLVAGVFQAGFQEYDSRLVYVHIKELQRFKYHGKDTVSGVDLRLDDPEMAPDVGGEIRQALGDKYSVLEWQKLNENLFSSIRTQKNIITIILGLVIFVASFNVLSALWTMTIRRTAEIAIIMSMGGTGPQVARIFQVTGMTIGLAGSLAGVAFGLMMCWLVELYGYTLDPEVYFIERLPVEVNPVQIAWILGLSLAFCFVATIPPAHRAARMRPVEGLRYE